MMMSTKFSNLFLDYFLIGFVYPEHSTSPPKDCSDYTTFHLLGKSLEEIFIFRIEDAERQRCGKTLDKNGFSM
jgi:hypothetical protein